MVETRLRSSAAVTDVLKVRKPNVDRKLVPLTASAPTKTRSHATVPHIKAAKRRRLSHSSDERVSKSWPVPPRLYPGVLNEALAHLSGVDSRFHGLSDRFVCKPWTSEGLAERPNHFRSLALGIISQQVSGAAARSIARKFVALFLPSKQAPQNLSGHEPESLIDVEIDPEVEDGPLSAADSQRSLAAPAIDVLEFEEAADDQSSSSTAIKYFPSPSQVAAKEVLFLKSAGLSLRKAEYIQGLAQAFAAKNSMFTDNFFESASDEEIVEALTSLRGIGPWSAEMFLMFSLKRLDVVSYGDIGIQRGMAWWLGKNPLNKSSHVPKHEARGKFKFVSQREMDDLSDSWRPFRSIGCWMMWRIDTTIEVPAPTSRDKRLLVQDLSFSKGHFESEPACGDIQL
ncbi:3-methyladenine DNA glycosylase [Savitreella phatthalungensis]